MTNTPIRIAVLGAGRIGQVHCSVISSLEKATLSAIADPLPAASKLMNQKYGCDIRTIEEIIVAVDIDAVVICTPTDTHANLIEQFSNAGKAIFCEKPIDLNAKRANECLKVTIANDTLFMLGFQRRFDPDFASLKHSIEQGEIGDIEMVTLTSRDPAAPPASYIERSGGIFRDMTIHDFDVARWLLGEEVTQIYAAASVLVDPEIGKLGDFDSVNIILKTKSGKQATINNSRRAAYGYDQRIEVHGSKGAISASNQHQNRVEIATEKGYSKPPLLNFFMSRYTEAYRAEINAFVNAISSNTPAPTTGYDGLMALVLAEACERSVKQNRVVQIAEILEEIA